LAGEYEHRASLVASQQRNHTYMQFDFFVKFFLFVMMMGCSSSSVSFLFGVCGGGGGGLLPATSFQL
jgi:hypothetical protein